ncbi:MAG TPA: DUF268 domain-containing protein [Stellaceae bacterium]|nr:DUF268 domain-containing protein [Stellaceae bacterium]
MKGRWLFWRDLRTYRRLPGGAENPVTRIWPFYRDRFRQAGDLGEYFHQDLWAARKVFAARPARHVDVGSRVDGFIAHCLAFMEVEVVDIRPLPRPPQGLRFIQGDAATMAGFADESIPSLSSLHAAEHFGLGRYGDAIDPLGHVTFMRSLARVLARRGRLYFSCPVGRSQKVEFNAHRILQPESVLDAMPALRLASFGLVLPGGIVRDQAAIDEVKEIDYGVGLFEFTRD